MRSKIYLLVFYLVFLVFMIGCSKKPICGNGVVEKDETELNCCEDTGCSNNKVCRNHVCLFPQCSKCQYLENGICIDYKCCNDWDCLGQQKCKHHICVEPKCGNCEYLENHECIEFACCSNNDCNDNRPETLDICKNASTREAICLNKEIELKDAKLLNIEFFKSDVLTGFLQETGCPSQEWTPVCGENDVTYPTACIADYEGATIKKTEICQSTLDFMRSLYKLPDLNLKKSYDVENIPILYNLYAGTLDYESKTGNNLRSTIWVSPNKKIQVNYHIIDGAISKKYISYRIKDLTMINALLIYYDFGDTGYPKRMYEEWTEEAIQNLNNYFKLKASKYNFLPPSISFDRIKLNSKYGWDEIIDKFYGTNLKRTNFLNELELESNKDFDSYDMIIFSPLKLNCGGGSQGYHHGDVLIFAPICADTYFSTNNKKEAYTAFLDFYDSWQTISHEILHSFGMSGDHINMGPGVHELSLRKTCNTLIDENVIAIEPDVEFKIEVGNEPEGIIKIEGNNGDCITVKHYLEGKDIDNDGIYEVVVSLQLIGDELLEELGWKDIDGDGVAPLNDQTPYGRLEEHNLTSEDLSILHQSKESYLGKIISKGDIVSIKDCDFLKIRVKQKNEDTNNLMIPKKCAKFNFFINDLYLNGPYYRFNIIDDSDYGEVALVTM